jgi:hypothetical protein
MNPNQQHNLKISTVTLRLLKLIAAHTGERQYAVLARLIAQEWGRVQQRDGATAQKGT